MHEIYLVDGSCFVYRAYHAIKGLRTSKGIPTNAVYGFTRTLLKILKEKNIQYLLIAFDSPHPTKRHLTYEQYKITRPETPKDLPGQIEYIKKIIDAFGIFRIEIPGYEADDIIATVAYAFQPLDCYIVSLDKDMLQIVSDRIKIYDPLNDQIIDREFIIKKYGIGPEKFTDFMALVGDSIDNIPGVKGIGEKLASQLLKKYDSVENIVKNLDTVKPKKLSELIRQNLDSLKLSRELVALKTDVPLKIAPEELKVREPDRERLLQIFKELEFSSLLKEILSDEMPLENIVLKYEESAKIIEKIREQKKFAIISPNDEILIGIDGDVYPIKASLEEVLYSDFLKIIYDVKKLLKKLKRLGIKLSPPYFDLMIAAYLVNPNKGKYDLNELVVEYLDNRNRTLPELMMALYERLRNELREKGLEELYFDIEMLLIEVLHHMEESGIKVDVNKLRELAKQISFEIDKTKEKIYSLAGTEFNINSPKQLAEILYNKLGLKSGKRGKKARSTEMEILEELSFQHEIAQEIINYRILNKLLTGYLLPLHNYINPETQRIHTKWSQTVAGTGRIISSEPNLQNIPVKGHWAELLREVFVPEEGFLFLSADYSQIELRLLAHLSEDPALIKAFREGKDIHTKAASEIFSIPEDKVTEEQRRIAKTVNFGIFYGISPFGLSESIKIPYEKAEELIDLYFLRYPGVKKFIDETLSFARQNGYVRTLFGRIRPVPDINSPNQFLRMQAERVAINARVQGTVADIIKIAMIRIYERIKKERLLAKLILQIHDEIVLEVEQKEAETLSSIVQREMKDFSLAVPLEVNIFTGRSLNL